MTDERDPDRPARTREERRDTGVDPVSVHEQSKYERMWSVADYRGDHVTAHARRALEHMTIRAGDSLIDFGSGAGYASAHFKNARLRVLAIDIAGNAWAPEVPRCVPLLLSNLWEVPVDLAADWGFCCDVMEHIPTERVDDVLRFVRKSTRDATYFSMSLRPDDCGRLIGEHLHLTVNDADWWTAQVRRHWRDVSVLDHQPGEVVVLIADGRIGRHTSDTNP